MPYEVREMSGSLFRNKKKEKETHADMNGTAKIDGVEYYINGWTKEGDGGKWLSLSFKPKAQAAPPAKPEDIEDDIPF